MKPYKRYIGNLIIFECAVGFLLLLFLPTLFAFLLFAFGDLKEPLVLLPLIIAQIFLIFVWVYTQKLFYCVCEFHQNHLEVKTLIGKNTVIEYTDIRDAKIIYYDHKILLLGFRVYSIILADEFIDYMAGGSVPKLNGKCIQLGYRKQTFDFLLTHLSDQAKNSLEKSYSEMKQSHKLKDKKIML